MNHVNLSISDELVKAAKEADINMSALLRKALIGELELKDTIEIDKIIIEVQVQRKKYEELEKNLLIRKQELIEDEKRKKNELVEKFKDVPEIQNLTNEQLVDVKLMLKLVDLIREKYGKKIGTLDIQKYHEYVFGSKIF